MKSIVREGSDSKISKKNNRSFEKECKKTGGGRPPREPPLYDPDNEEGSELGLSIEQNVDEQTFNDEPTSVEGSQGSVVRIFRQLTNNTVPLPTRDNDVAITKEVF
jgi:hypothetical protein